MRDNSKKRIKERIKEANYGTVFVAKDFLDITEYEVARKALNRLTDDGIIKKIIRGVYYNPRFSEKLMEYEAPSPHQVALALARKFNWSIAPSGITALNLLGLSTQVSAKWSYISDGAYNSFKIDNITIEFKHRNNREIAGMSYKTALIIQAIKALGKDNVDNTTIVKIRALLTEEERQVLLAESKLTMIWIHQIIRKICRGN
ncbi:MAG: type IV toxin-antitoxin system AbiEi family antitoxin domain-containing protein [Oscillospiraceae bacterium]|nr:type IV toxin-antitoxin system AbiEi family antitoxin domain-containing protein [Oscillospiraceae bacterium]